MKERPIIFGAESVRAILAGTKTQTRRVVRWPVLSRSDGAKRRVFGPDEAEEINQLLAEKRRHPCQRIACPYGVPGDKLWIREAWLCGEPALPCGRGFQLRADGGGSKLIYRADGGYADDPPPWRSPIHMPHWASRITLEVLDVRVQRLQEITAEDAVAEGVERLDPRASDVTLVGRFARAWDGINGKREGCSWAANPFVWAITFRRVET